MKSFLVIGLGRFGRHLTRYLLELGNEVMVLDKDEEKVAKVAGMATAACVGDCQDEQVLESLGVRNFDICFVCVRDDFQCSLEATAALKELGARFVVARADQERQIKFLRKIGADHVVHTEMDMARRAAIRFSAENVFDYFELTPKFAIFELEIPEEWEGHTVMELEVKFQHRIRGFAHAVSEVMFHVRGQARGE
ncbi:MAG: TrkA family potassium uptake protein [Oscillibacter sp.]|nr:TrkA family potassium uptake protein [Oscillibacter sp.]